MKNKERPTHLVIDTAKMPRYMRWRLQKRGAIPIIAEGANGVPNKPWSMIFNRWSNAIYAQHSKNTAAIYSSYVKKFIGNLNDMMFLPTEKQLTFFINASGISYQTRKTRRNSLDHFFEYVKNDGLVDFNPVKNIQATWRDLPQSLSIPNPDPPFTQEEVDRMMANTEDFNQFWRWGVAIAYYMGLRLGDVAMLQWGAWKEDELHLRTAKTGAIIILPYDHPQLGAGFIRKILAEMRAYSRCKPGPDKMCWVRIAAAYNKGPNRLHSHFRKICERTGIRGKGFHSLRRGCATRCHAAGLSIEDIGKFLGHSSAEMSATYIHAPINRSELNGSGR